MSYDSYYVNRNAQPTGEHEVHRKSCYRLPSAANRVYLGEFATSQEAVRAAQAYYSSVDGCAYCCRESHTR